jgi:tRNA threonylcarbamoyladenosine biosynthesis protein TsaE
VTDAGLTLETGSSEETERAGARFVAGLQAGDVVLVVGEVGAGKTTFVRGACRALGVTGPVTSPTFTIGQRYPAAGPAATVSHLDLYRIGDLRDEDPDLLADYINDEAIAFVEWPDGAQDELAAFGRVVASVHLAHAGGDRRTLEIVRR